MPPGNRRHRCFSIGKNSGDHHEIKNRSAKRIGAGRHPEPVLTGLLNGHRIFIHEPESLRRYA